MHAATYTQGGEFEVKDLPRPEVVPGGLLLRILATSICGTDIKIMHHGHRKLADGQCIALGHEIVGEIAEIGDGTEGFQVGQRVGVAPNAGCGTCRNCRRGEANYCSEFTAFGIDRDGAHAEYMAVPAKFVTQGNILPLPDEISDVAAAMLEPLSCVVNGASSVGVGKGDVVVIYGVGPMGLLHVLTARALGADKIIAVDPQPKRLEQAVDLGAYLGINPQTDDVKARVMEATDGEGADVVITACPVAAVQNEALSLLATHGRLCLFGGLPKGTGAVPLDTNDIHYRHLTVTGTTGGSVANYRAALDLVMSDGLDPTRVISDTFSLNELGNAYQKALEGPMGKVVMVAS